MNGSKIISCKIGLVRFLTLASFFNFSGLNNGYAYVQSITPLNTTDSVSILAQTLKATHGFIAPTVTFYSIHEGYRSAVLLTFKTRHMVRRAFNICVGFNHDHRVPEPLVSIERDKPAQNVTGTRADYLQEKEVWDRMMKDANTDFDKDPVRHIPFIFESGQNTGQLSREIEEIVPNSFFSRTLYRSRDDPDALISILKRTSSDLSPSKCAHLDGFFYGGCCHA